MEDQVGQQDPQNPAVGNSDPQAEFKAQIAKLDFEKNELHGRATRAEETLKRVNEELASLKKAQSPAPQPSDELASIKRELEITKLVAAGHTPEEAKFVVEAPGGLENPFVKEGIEAMRAKKKVEQATPAPSSRGSAPKPQFDFVKASKAERKEYWRSLLNRKQAGQQYQ